MQLNRLQRACTGAPLVIGEPLYAWREWSLTPDGLRGALGRLWEPGVNAAQCHSKHAIMRRVLDDMFTGSGVETPVHTVEPWCACGLYGWRRPDKISARTTKIAGVVEMWGRVLIGERGLRAQYGRVVALVGPASDRNTARLPRPTVADCRAAATRYGATHFTTLEDATTHFAEGGETS